MHNEVESGMKEINSQIIHLRTKRTMSFSRKNSMHKPFRARTQCINLTSWSSSFLILFFSLKFLFSLLLFPFFFFLLALDMNYMFKKIFLPLLMCGKLPFSHSCYAMLRLPPLVAIVIHQYPTFLLLCSSLPYFRCCMFCYVVLSFVMIINLLVWANARNTHGQQEGDSFAA